MKGGRICHCLLWAALFSLPPAASGLEVRDVRLWRAPDHTRIVFDLSGPVEHELGRLNNPRRIYVDLADTGLEAGLDRLSLTDTPITRVRSGIRKGDDLRVVFELGAPVEPHLFMLEANERRGDRLVLDLKDSPVAVATRPSVKKSVADSARRDIVIAIDAGHGGEDPGAIGPGGLHEKNVVLKIAKEVYALFEKERGFRPELIRTGDYYVSLKKRRDIAREAQADLLVSIHADAFKSPRAKGASVYTLSQRGASSTSARFLAQRENASDLVGGVRLSDYDDLVGRVLYDMSMDSTLEASLGLGGQVLVEIERISRLHRRRVEQAAFAVLKSPDIPSFLVETGFISNPEDARRLNTRGYQRRMARAIHGGIVSWFVEKPPADTLLAWRKRAGGREYVIARGDTLSEIAQRFNVTVASLRALNSLPGNTIYVGQKLIIPAT